MRTRVKDVMTTDVVAVHQDTTFHEVAELLIEHGVSGLPVLDDEGRVAGVVTRDVLDVALARAAVDAYSEGEGTA